MVRRFFSYQKCASFFFYFFSFLLGVGTLNYSYAVNMNPLAFDYNKNGKIDTRQEKEALIRWINEHFEAIPDERAFLGNSSSVKVAEPKVPRPDTYDVGFKVRRDFKEISLLDGIGGQLPTKGALFSYTRDLLGDRQIAAAKGAVYFPFILVPGDERNDTIPTNQEMLIYKQGSIFGLEFDYLDTGGARPTNNDLDFYFGYQQAVLGGPFNANYFRFSAQYETDFDFDASMLAGELSWWPVDGRYLLNSPANLGNGLVRFQPAFSIDAKYKQIVDVGDRMQLKGQDSYYGVGVSMGVDAYLFSGQLIDLAADRAPIMHLYTRWNPVWGDLPSGHFEQLITAGAEVFFGASQNFSLGIDYKNGTMPYTGKDVEQIVAGFSVKF